MQTNRFNNTLRNRRAIGLGVLALAAIAVPLANSTKVPLAAVPAQATQAAKSDRWIHVRVVNKDAKGETVRVNVPLDMAEKVLPAFTHKNFRNGKVRFTEVNLHDIDVRALLDAVRTSRDGEFVTVQSHENDVRVAKQSGFLLVNVTEHNAARTDKVGGRVEVRMPITVVNALLSGPKDELDLVAGIRALATQPDMELVSVQDKQNTVRVWLDSKNATE
jgi:acid phosphatase class B